MVVLETMTIGDQMMVMIGDRMMKMKTQVPMTLTVLIGIMMTLKKLTYKLNLQKILNGKNWSNPKLNLLIVNVIGVYFVIEILQCKNL